MDDSLLLKKYIEYVRSMEGTDFLSDAPYGDHFTTDELNRLNELAASIEQDE